MQIASLSCSTITCAASTQPQRAAETLRIDNSKTIFSLIVSHTVSLAKNVFPEARRKNLF